MVFDGTLGRLAAVFGGVGGGKMPFDEGGAANEGHVVEVVNVEVQVEADAAGFGNQRVGHCCSLCFARSQCDGIVIVAALCCGIGCR